MARAAITGEKISIAKGRCKYNPLKKCAFSSSESQTVYTARSALILTALKLEDDLADKDTPLYKRALSKPLHSHLIRRIKKLTKEHKEYTGLIDAIRAKLKELGELEDIRSPELDKVCEIFGDIMALTAGFALSEESAAIAHELGSSIGRYIYIVDAIDDIDKDEKSGAYNPLIARYGSAKDAKDSFSEVDIALAMFAKRAVLASNLLKECDYSRIIDNTLSRGLGTEAYKIMTKNGDKK